MLGYFCTLGPHRLRRTAAFLCPLDPFVLVLVTAAETGAVNVGTRRNAMKPSSKHQIKGKLHEVKGNVKKKAGQMTNDLQLKAEGQDEALAGTIQKKVGQIEKVFEK